MFFNRRAGGLAAAAFLLAAGIAFADPGKALESDSAPLAFTYADHATADLDAAALAPPAAPDFSSEAVTPLADAPDADAAPAPRALGDLVARYAASDTADAEQECLAGAVYFEAKGEPLEGQLAVADVIINRSQSGRFPASLCGVVRQRSQFSFVRGGHIPAAPRASAAWRKAVAIAHIAQASLADSAAGARAMFFHASSVHPGWRGVTRIAAVGNHVFYR